MHKFIRTDFEILYKLVPGDVVQFENTLDKLNSYNFIGDNYYDKIHNWNYTLSNNLGIIKDIFKSIFYNHSNNSIYIQLLTNNKNKLYKIDEIFYFYWNKEKCVWEFNSV